MSCKHCWDILMGKGGFVATSTGQQAWYLLQLTQRAAEPQPRLLRFCRCQVVHRTAGAATAGEHCTIRNLICRYSRWQGALSSCEVNACHRSSVLTLAVCMAFCSVWTTSSWCATSSTVLGRLHRSHLSQSLCTNTATIAGTPMQHGTYYLSTQGWPVAVMTT